MPHTPCLLTIAGTDPCGGAGIPVDLQVFRDFGFHGLSVVSAVISQNTRGVQAVEAMDAVCVTSQLETLFDDIMPVGIKIGLLPNAKVVEAVSQVLKRQVLKSLRAGHTCPVIFDPVLASSSGHQLADSACVGAMREHLIPRVDLLTPNLHEAEILLDATLHSRSKFRAAAGKLVELGCGAVLLKAGHFTPQESGAAPAGSSVPRQINDLFADRFGIETLADLPAIPDDVRGTGCQLSSAISANIVRTKADACSGKKDARPGLIAAIEQSRAYLNHLLHTRRRNIGGGRPVILRGDV